MKWCCRDEEIWGSDYWWKSFQRTLCFCSLGLSIPETFTGSVYQDSLLLVYGVSPLPSADWVTCRPAPFLSLTFVGLSSLVLLVFLSFWLPHPKNPFISILVGIQIETEVHTHFQSATFNQESVLNSESKTLSAPTGKRKPALSWWHPMPAPLLAACFSRQVLGDGL